MPVASNGHVDIWYETLGNGPPLVMLYGIGGNSRRWWTDFPRRLSERYTLVMLDNRGVGRSSQPRETWTMADVVADIDAVVEATGIDSFHLLGCSLGSIYARGYAAARPSRLRSLSLLCPPNGIPASEEDMKLGVMWDPAVPRLESERASWAVVHPQSFIDSSEGALLADFEASEAERTPARTFRFQLECVMSAPDPLPGINDAAWPVFILHGTVDRLVPPANASTLHAAIPRAQLTWLEGDCHCFWMHDPERSAEAVLSFLQSAEGAI
jgi:pimeloyl-ACP methyl ester carboxylesterase